YAPFVVDPGKGDRVLYGATHVWETTNGGDSWTALGPSFPGTVNAIGLSASDSDTVYAAVGPTIYFTNNHVATWTAGFLPVGGTVQDIQVDPLNPVTAYAVVRQFTYGGNVFRTSNGGNSWINISGDLPSVPAWSLQSDATSETLYVGNDIGVYQSLNGGL